MSKIIRHNIAIIGTGYVGLPLLMALSADESNVITGYDTSHKKIENLKATTRYYKKNVKFSDNLEDLRNVTFFIVCVPTPADQNNHPDTSDLFAACDEIGKVIKKGDCVVFESTVYPEMTENHCIPIIEKVSGLRAKEDFVFGYSPERINIGDKEHTLQNTVKLVSGCDEDTCERINNVYTTIPGLKTKQVRSIKVAEASKLMENTQRDILIAFANEYNTFCQELNIDIDDVIDAASTKWNFSPVRPGLVGGHCIGVDPYYLISCAEKHGLEMPLVSTARSINETEATKVSSSIIHRLGELSITKGRILVLGLAYKKNTGDIRNSKIAKIVSYLTNHEFEVDIFDPLVKPEDAWDTYQFHLVSEDDIRSRKYDCIYKAVDHDVFEEVNLKEALLHSPVIFKTKDLL